MYVVFISKFLPMLREYLYFSLISVTNSMLTDIGKALLLCLKLDNMIFQLHFFFSFTLNNYNHKL